MFPASDDEIRRSLPVLRKPSNIKDSADEISTIEKIMKANFGCFGSLLNKDIANHLENRPVRVLLGNSWLVVNDNSLSKAHRFNMLLRCVITKITRSGLSLVVLEDRDSPYEIEGEWEHDYGISGSSDMPIIVFIKD